MGISIYAFTRSVGRYRAPLPYDAYDPAVIDSNIVRCPDPATASRMIELIKEVKADGDTIGGIVECVVKGCPAGLGDPVFGKLHAMLGAAMLGINAAKGLTTEWDLPEHPCAAARPSTFEIDPVDGSISFAANHSGGIRGA